MKKNIFYLLLIFLSSNILAEDVHTFLVFGGKTGWIGQQLVKIINKQGYKAVPAQSRLENRKDIETEIKNLQPNCIINAAGRTGIPNVDWCESHKQETMRTNIIGALNLADIAFQHNIHMINLGTGCIYEYDNTHPMHSGKGYTEQDTPNFHGSFYSHTKVMLDNLLQSYPNVLNLRLRMPISDDLHPRSFVTKITKYKKVINIPNSMSVLRDLLPLIPEMAQRKLTGNYNFTNSGTISHNEVLDLYKEYIDPDFSYENFSVEEQDKILRAKRSNNELDSTKLLQEFPEILNIKRSITNVFKRMKKNWNNK